MAKSTLLKSDGTFDAIPRTAVQTPVGIVDSMATAIIADDPHVDITLGDVGASFGSQEPLKASWLASHSGGLPKTKSDSNAAFTASITDPAPNETGFSSGGTVMTAGYNADTGMLSFVDPGYGAFVTTLEAGQAATAGNAAVTGADMSGAVANMMAGSADGSANGVGAALSAMGSSILPVTDATFYPSGATKAQILAAVNLTGANVTKYTGNTINVGVLSDSFNFLGNASADYGTALPTNGVTVIQDLPNPNKYGIDGTDEGRAMLQIVHAIAPDAKLFFATGDYHYNSVTKQGDYSDQAFADNILALAAAGCNVICDDLTSLAEPFFQTGVIAQAIETVEAEGVIYLSSAGNQAAAAYQGTWNPITTAVFDGVTMTNAATLNPGHASNKEIQTVVNSTNVSDFQILQWNQPFGAATTVLGMLVFHNGSLVQAVTNGASGTYGYTLGGSVTQFTQSDFGYGSTVPFIETQLPGNSTFNVASGNTYQIAIVKLSGTDPNVIKDLLYNDYSPIYVSMDDANAGTVIGHHMDPDQIAIGAVDSANTPGNGVSTPVSEDFSSSDAKTTLYFDANGNPVNGTTGLSLNPIGLSGVDDIDTTVPGGLADFFGTSAATPSVAAVVADILQKNPHLTLAQVENILESTATSFGDPNVAGAGLVNADSALAMACYCRGTMILTETGEVPVEKLRIGDLLVTRSEELRPIRWIGRRGYDGRFIAGNRDALPIRIAANAIMTGVPARDLWVSPEHALYIDDFLVQAKHLVNGATVVQVQQVDEVEYFHIELESHDIIYADGMPAETFVDCDNRLMFANGAEYPALYPNDDNRPRWQFCAPRLEWGSPDLVAIRDWMLEHAGRLDHTVADDLGLCLLIDGTIQLPTRVTGNAYRFELAAGCGEVWLGSRSIVPAECSAMLSDVRRLGMPLERITLSDSDTSLDVWHGHSAFRDGFHADEAAHRWTDGNARIPDALFRPFGGHPITLDVRLAAAPYIRKSILEDRVMPLTTTGSGGIGVRHAGRR